MQKLSLFAGLLAAEAMGGIVFRDVRPQSYNPDRRLNVFSGKLFSPSLALSKDFYSINYCLSTNRRGYSDLLVNQFEDSEYVEGVTEYDTELHETFLDYKVTQTRENAVACERTLSLFDVN